ncbi:MAG TPA: hypothetical protein VJJ83_04900, partial [Candidatus Babeliales bacterium]|nr:hypothetical protein [Candidatus Babeliales bacterium]
GTEQQATLQGTMQNLALAAQNISVFTDTLVQNRAQFEQLLTNTNQLTGDLAPLGPALQTMAQQINHDILPNLAQSLAKVSALLETDMGQVVQQLGSTVATVQSVAEKIDHGDGLLGKLINETEVYDDLRTVSHGLKSYAALIDNMGVVVDTHFESMYRPADDYQYPDSKGYFNFRLYTAEDWFYLFQLAGSERGGVVERTETINQYQDSDQHELTDPEILQAHLEPKQTEKLVLKRNLARYGLQFGKVFNNWCFRFGLFENSFGLAADYYIPFYDEKIRFISTLEAFDFRGQDRLDDRRPHLKWLNRIFILDAIYFTVGADDFVSKHNKNLFVGLGLRFTDDSLKYMFDRLGLGNNAR